MSIDPNLKVQNANTFDARLTSSNSPVTHGLTKREYFASLAMQALVTSLAGYKGFHTNEPQVIRYPHMDEAVIIADKLIESLNK